MSRYTPKQELRVRQERIDEITVSAANAELDRQFEAARRREDREYGGSEELTRSVLAEVERLRREDAAEWLAELDEEHGGVLSGRGLEWPTRGERS
jgi:hypothetical protein